MTTPCSGPISLGDVQAEVPGVPIGLGDADVRGFASIPSGAISLFDCYCLPQTSPADIAIGDAYNVTNDHIGGGEYSVNARWDVGVTGFSGNPECEVTGYAIDLGIGLSEPFVTFNSTGTQMNMQIRMAPDGALYPPILRFSIRLFITYYWPQEVGATEQASDVAYLSLEWAEAE